MRVLNSVKTTFASIYPERPRWPDPDSALAMTRHIEFRQATKAGRAGRGVILGEAVETEEVNDWGLRHRRAPAFWPEV